MIRECIQKFPDWPPGARTANGTALCHKVQLYRYVMSLSVSFAAITLCVASQGVFIVVVYFVMTQSGNFWIHPRTCLPHLILLDRPNNISQKV
jgi:hypothetical protein